MRFLSLLLIFSYLSFPLLAQDFDDEEELTAPEEFNLIIKSNFLTLLSGELPVMVEYKLEPRLSVQAGVGVTFASFFYNTWRTSETDNNWGEPRTALPGFSARAALRFYAEQQRQELQHLEGLYFSPEVQYKLYRSRAQECDPNIPNEYTLGFNSEFRSIGDLRLLIGYQEMAGEHFVIDFYGGLGVRLRQTREYTCEWSASQLQFVSLPETESRGVPVLAAGFHIGYGL